jgi:acetyltransferase EpsM
MSEYLILGKGGHARSIADAIYSTNPEAQISNYFFPSPSASDLSSLLEPNLRNLTQDMKLVLGVGDVDLRKQIIKLVLSFLPKTTFATVIHKSAVVSKNAQIGIGSTVLANTYIGPGTNVGDFCIVNTNSVIDHDSSIGDHTVLSVSVSVAGGSTIGKSCFLGMGACITDGVTIGNHSTLGANSYVHSSFPDNSFLIGSPARMATR